MTISDLEQRCWELQKCGLLLLQELGFMVFLLRSLQQKKPSDNVLRWSDVQLCRELSISRKSLRRLRLRLIELGLLVVQTSEGKGGGTTYILYPAEPVTAILPPVDTVHEAILYPMETVTAILYPVETVTEVILYPVGTVCSTLNTPPRPCSPLPPSAFPRIPLSSPPITPSNPPPLRGAGRERETGQPMPLVSKSNNGTTLVAEPAEETEGPSLEDVLAYFETKSYVNPQREGEKFWQMRYWQSRRGMHWHHAASLWNDRALDYQEKLNAPHRTTHTNSRSRDEKQKRNLAIIRANREAAERETADRAKAGR